MKLLQLSFTFCLTISLVLSGCGHKDPLDDIVVATSGFNLIMWKAKVADDFSMQEWHDFDEAVQEVKFDVMTSGEATGSEGIRDAAFQRIDGKAVREVLKMGLGFKLKRLSSDREATAKLLERNSKLRTREGDDESAIYLKNLMFHQANQLDLLARRIEDVRAILKRRKILDLQRANQALEPTRLLVMPRACARVTPINRVAVITLGK